MSASIPSNTKPTVSKKIIKKEKEDPSFRLIDFHTVDKKPVKDEGTSSEDSDEGTRQTEYIDEYDSFTAAAATSSQTKKQHKSFRPSDEKRFIIQMFGINEAGETCSIMVDDYLPFFYVKVADNWTNETKKDFVQYLKSAVGKYYEASILEDECRYIQRKKLYGFDGGKEHKFLIIKFTNVPVMNKVKNLWFEEGYDHRHSRKCFRLKPNGVEFNDTSVTLYEANIPPLLRFFHIREISPSGWIQIPLSRTKVISNKTTTCKYEYKIGFKDIMPLNQKETIVPYKICSFDIEASSSHGDFPIPVKTYKKLATNIADLHNKMYNKVHDTASSDPSFVIDADLLRRIIYTAYGFDTLDGVERVFPKKQPTKDGIDKLFSTFVSKQLRTLIKETVRDENTIERLFERIKLEHGKNETQKSMDDDGEDDGDADGDGDGAGDGDDKHRPVEEEEITGPGKAEYYDKKKDAAIAAAQSQLSITILDLINSRAYDRETKIAHISDTLGSVFPKLEGDKVTFIGSTFIQYGKNDNKPYLNHCIAMNTCNDLTNEVPNSEIETYATESEVLLAWTALIQRENPDIIIGYNIFGFDYEFMFRRALENKCEEDFLMLSRNEGEFCGNRDAKTGKISIEQTSIALASGQYELRFVKMTGRLQIDLYNYFRRDFNLTSYKLDYVSGYFIGDDVKKMVYDADRNRTSVVSGNLAGLEVGNYINFEESSHSTDSYKDGAKFKILALDKETRTFEIEGREEPDMKKSVRWGLAKDDVTPQDIFRMTNEGPAERATIAKYCIQDCNLVHHLMNKIDVMTGYIEMSKICSVPISFLVMRGQGIKLTSYIAKKCREKNTLMPVIDKDLSDDSYEGAIVLPPKCNLYLDNPVACLDYSSLYPSSMISENLSHDSKVWTKEYDLFKNLVHETGEKDAKTGEYIYDNLPGYEYVNVEYDTYKWVANERGKMIKTLNGKKICRWAQPKDGIKAIMPSVLEELLAARKATRKLAESQTDPFMANILDKRQLGYKVTANSLYGQCGAKTSTFYEVDVAASTTATGRKLLTYGKRIVEEVYGNATVNTKNYGFVNTKAEYIYGDTDSVFFTFNLATPDGTPIRGKDALEITIEIAQQVGHLATKFLKPPHAWVYEKTLMPFCLLSKKRYVGMLYENNTYKGKRKSMGIVLKRRDNAPIVKDVYGGIIDILMKEQNIERAIAFLRECMQNIIDEKCPLEKLIITKSLRSDYKNPQQIAHKVLADRMGVRDPGNKPSTGDRIPYVYINNKSKTALQGERIEHPDYIVKNNLRPNYSFYITNQIMKPVQQVFALVLEKIPGFDKRKQMQFENEIETLVYKFDDEEKREKKITELRQKMIKSLLFDEYLIKADNLNKGNQDISNFFKKKTAV